MGTGLQPPTFHYAGVSVGGAVGLQLLLDAPDRVETAILLCTGARIGTSGSWAERVDEVRASGTASLTPSATQRWFAGGFLDRCPETGEALLSGLGDVVDEGYAAVCGALAGFDVRPRLGRIHTPVLAVAGADDVVTPTDSLREIAEGVMEGRLVVLDGVGHLAPAEAPQAVALLVLEHALGPDALPLGPGLAGGHGVDFDDLVTGLEVEGAWARPGLARRDRSLVALTALVAGGRPRRGRRPRSARTQPRCRGPRDRGAVAPDGSLLRRALRPRRLPRGPRDPGCPARRRVGLSRGTSYVWR